MAVNTTLRLDQTKLAKQLRRLRGFGKYAEFADELARIVNRHAAHDEHVERIIDHILATLEPNEEGYVPCITPKQMADYCLEVPDNLSGLVPADPDCAMCGGTGWEQVDREDSSKGVRRCSCRKQNTPRRAPQKPAIQPAACGKCSGFSTVRNALGRHEWCDCEQARWMKQQVPNWVALLNNSEIRAERQTGNGAAVSRELEKV